MRNVGRMNYGTRTCFLTSEAEKARCRQCENGVTFYLFSWQQGSETDSWLLSVIISIVNFGAGWVCKIAYYQVLVLVAKEKIISTSVCLVWLVWFDTFSKPGVTLLGFDKRYRSIVRKVQRACRKSTRLYVILRIRCIKSSDVWSRTLSWQQQSRNQLRFCFKQHPTNIFPQNKSFPPI